MDSFLCKMYYHIDGVNLLHELDKATRLCTLQNAPEHSKWGQLHFEKNTQSGARKKKSHFCLHMIGWRKSAELRTHLIISGATALAKCTVYLPLVNQPLCVIRKLLQETQGWFSIQWSWLLGEIHCINALLAAWQDAAEAGWRVSAEALLKGFGRDALACCCCVLPCGQWRIDAVDVAEWSASLYQRNIATFQKAFGPEHRFPASQVICGRAWFLCWTMIQG